LEVQLLLVEVDLALQLEVGYLEVQLFNLLQKLPHHYLEVQLYQNQLVVLVMLLINQHKILVVDCLEMHLIQHLIMLSQIYLVVLLLNKLQTLKLLEHNLQYLEVLPNNKLLLLHNSKLHLLHNNKLLLLLNNNLHLFLIKILINRERTQESNNRCNTHSRSFLI